MTEYRWNVADYAAGFDAAAEHIHPHYLEIQDKLLELISPAALRGGLLLDLGGGSGRFAARALERFFGLKCAVLDQSAAFLDLARARLARFGNRAACIEAHLQDDWQKLLPGAPTIITSMSAIHHLEPAEKQTLYARCYEVLPAGGLFLNADEIRPADEADYLSELKHWADHKSRIVREGLVDDRVRDLLDRWHERNIVNFAKPRTSGDDCHEPVDVQLDYLRQAGFAAVDVSWQREMWAVMRAVKR